MQVVRVAGAERAVNDQLALVLPPASATNDPITSYIAERRITRSGKRRNQCEIVLDALRRYPNRTAGELARDTGLDYYMLSRRLSDLGYNHLAAAKAKRQCEAGHGLCQVWQAT